MGIKDDKRYGDESISLPMIYIQVNQCDDCS